MHSVRRGGCEASRDRTCWAFSRAVLVPRAAGSPEEVGSFWAACIGCWAVGGRASFQAQPSAHERGLWHVRVL